MIFPIFIVKQSLELGVAGVDEASVGVVHVVLGVLGVHHACRTSAVIGVFHATSPVLEVGSLHREHVAQAVVGIARLAAGGMDDLSAAVAVVVCGLRDVALGVGDTDQAPYAVIDKTRGKGGTAGRALVLDALDGLAAAVDQSGTAVALGIGHRGLYRVANEGICVGGIGRVGELHKYRAVKLVVLSAPRGDGVYGGAKTLNRRIVNRRVVNPDSTAERVILNPAARHHNLVGLSNKNEQQMKQQQK